MKEVYVVCQNFNTENVLVFAPAHGWNSDTAELYDSEIDAYMECADELTRTNVSIEKFIVSGAATRH